MKLRPRLPRWGNAARGMRRDNPPFVILTLSKSPPCQESYGFRACSSLGLFCAKTETLPARRIAANIHNLRDFISLFLSPGKEIQFTAYRHRQPASHIAHFTSFNPADGADNRRQATSKSSKTSQMLLSKPLNSTSAPLFTFSTLPCTQRYTAAVPATQAGTHKHAAIDTSRTKRQSSTCAGNQRY